MGECEKDEYKTIYIYIYIYIEYDPISDAYTGKKIGRKV